MREPEYETSVIVAKAEKLLYFIEVTGNRPIVDYIQLTLLHMNTFGIDGNAKKLHRLQQ